MCKFQMMIPSRVCQNWAFLASKFFCDILYFQMYTLVMVSSELKEFSTLAPNWFQSCDCCTWQLSTLDDLLQFTFIFFFSFTFTFLKFCLTNLILTSILTCQQLSINDCFPFFCLLSPQFLKSTFTLFIFSWHFLVYSFFLCLLCPLFVIDFFPTFMPFILDVIVWDTPFYISTTYPALF